MQPNYGSDPYNAPPPSLPAPRKEPFFSLIASFFIPGLGTILNGETRKGVTFMAVFYLSPVAGFMFALIVASIRDYVSPTSYLYGLFYLLLLVSAVAWFWGLIDAYKGAEAHNAKHGLH